MTNNKGTGISTDFFLTLWIMRLVGATHGKYENFKKKSFYYLTLMYNLIMIFIVVVFSLTNSIVQPLNVSNMESYGFSDITVYYFYCAYNTYRTGGYYHHVSRNNAPAPPNLVNTSDTRYLSLETYIIMIFTRWYDQHCTLTVASGHIIK